MEKPIGFLRENDETYGNNMEKSWELPG